MRYARAVCGVALLVVWPATAFCHPADRSITFAETLSRCKEAPSVRAVAEALRVKRSLDANLGAMVANPQLTVQAGYRNDSGGQGTDVQVSIQQGLNLAGFAKARRRTAALESAALQAEWQAALLHEQLGAVRLWSELWGAEQAEENASEEVELAKQLLVRTERLFAGGAVTQVDVATAKTYLAEVQTRHLSIEGEVVELGLSLSRWLGQSGALHAIGQPHEPKLPTLDDALVGEALRRLGDLPEPLRRRLGEQGERARADEVAAERGTQLAVGAMVLREPTAPWAAFGTLSLSVPVFERGQRERSNLMAMAARMKIESEAALSEAQGDFRQMLHDVSHFGELSKLITETLLPSAQREVSLRERLLLAGDGTVLEVLQARRAYLAARTQAARVQASLLWSRQRMALYLTALGLFDGENVR
jgi:outer membrane protein TolC